jgi:pimeloyl-ACP methyl ester carboxylesterase
MPDDPDRCPHDPGNTDDVRSAFDRRNPGQGASNGLPLTVKEGDAGFHHRRACDLTMSGDRWLAQPTLVMAGTDDPLVPFANGRILASLIPDARLMTIEDGHLFLVTNARQSAAMISEFLS